MPKGEQILPARAGVEPPSGGPHSGARPISHANAFAMLPPPIAPARRLGAARAANSSTRAQQRPIRVTYYRSSHVPVASANRLLLGFSFVS
eukprot:scaffold123509_cov33-Tisochrysis_lutea.AAC.1